MQRWLHRLLGKKCKRDILVVIWGVHSADWMTALAQEAPVWKALPEVVAVLHRGPPAERVPRRHTRGRRTVVIPLMEAHIAQRPKHYAALVPTREALAILADKTRFANYVRARSLAHLCPTTYASIETATFPCVIKRLDLNTGEGVEVAATPVRAQELLANAPFAGHPFVLQERVSFETEYVVHCVCRRGRILWHAAYAYDFPEQQIRKAGAHCTIRRTTVPESLLGELESILLPLEYSGPCNVDFILDADGRLKIFEINPRLGGSLMRPENLPDLTACLAAIIATATGESATGFRARLNSMLSRS